MEIVAIPLATVFMDVSMADKALFEFADVVDALGITWFLAFGTCLGMVREGGYIEGDNDIDVGVICSKETLSRFFAVLEARGFTRGSTFLNPGEERNQHFRKDGILIDIFFTFRHDTKPFIVFFDKIIYKGREMRVPHPVKEYLGSEYDDWRTPSGQKARGPGKRIEYLDFGG